MFTNNAVSSHIGKLITADRQCLCLVNALAPREALIRASLPLMAGQSVTLGLRNGLAVPAVVAFTQGEQVSLLFEKLIPISTMLAEQRRGMDPEESVRLTMTAPVSITTPKGSHSCILQDISLLGMKVRNGTTALDEGMLVQVSIKDLGKRDAQIRWCNGPYIGLRFQLALGYRMLDEWTMNRKDGPV